MSPCLHSDRLFLLDSLIKQARDNGSYGLTEPQGKAVLKACGLNVPEGRFVTPNASLEKIFNELRPPLALKVVSEQIIHKSDVGGVILNLNTLDSLVQARSRMLENLRINGLSAEGFLVEQMAPLGIEMVVGGFVDHDFGPMVMVGFGGVFVEVYKDVAFGICPIDRHDAMEMLNELVGAPILRGVRGSQPAEIEAIIDAMISLGSESGLLMRNRGEIAEIDINPLIVTDTHAYAVDARIILTKHE